MRTIGLAISQHVEANGTFPGGFGKPLDASYLVQILPYMEQQPLYHTINMTNFDWASLECNENTTAFAKTVETFVCPSDPARNTVRAKAAPNYAANAGDAGSESLRGDGPFIGRTLAPRDVTDGLSQTVGVSEWTVGPGVPRVAYRDSSIYRITQPLGPRDYAAFTQICAALDPRQVEPARPGVKGTFWLVGGLGRTQYNHTLPPNRPSCWVYGGIHAYTAGSYHGRGAHVLMLDGSARYVKDSVDARAWSSLGTRSGGEVVGDDAM
jgi:prepilin-type processing-associated H-X9-DG protein